MENSKRRTLYQADPEFRLKRMNDARFQRGQPPYRSIDDLPPLKPRKPTKETE